MTIEAIKAAIEQLTEPERRELAEWLEQLEEQACRRRLEMGMSSRSSGKSATPRSLCDIRFTPHKDPPTPSPSDWRDHPIYFLLVDRFNKDGRPNPPYVKGVTRRVRRKPSDGLKWQGGTLKGITQKLGYVKDLGFTAIWLSPIMKNRIEMKTYHGYAIQNFLEVDRHFGDLGDLRELVDTAHQMGMYVILDIVINHTGDNWEYDLPAGSDHLDFNSFGRYKFGFWRSRVPGRAATGIMGPDDAVWPKEFQNPEWYARKGRICHWDNPPEVQSGDLWSLKKLDISNPGVLTALIDVYKYWIAAADIDGYRLDAIKHVGDSSTAIFCSAIREYAQKVGKKNFFLFGEITENDLFINKFIGANARIPETYERFPALDSALDYPLWGVLEEVMKGFKGPFELGKRYEVFTHTYSDYGQASRFFVTFVDNHDQLGRNKRFLHGDGKYKQQAVLAVGYLLTSMGVPCLYYGTEQGFDGGGKDDRFVRETMFGGKWGAFETRDRHFFNTEHPFYQAISKIAELRRAEPALRYGRQYFREISANGKDFGHPADARCTLAYSRLLEDDEIVIAMNLDCEKEKQDFVNVDSILMPKGGRLIDLLLPAPDHPAPEFEVKVVGGRHIVKVPLQPLQMAILKRVP